MVGSKHNGNGHGRYDSGHVTETPDVSHIRNPDVTHEASDVNIPGILKFVMGLTVMGVAVFLLMWGMFRFLNAQETEKEPPPGPMAMSEQERLPPKPRLQAARGFGVTLENGAEVNLENKEPQAEYWVLHEQWERRLNCKNAEGVAETNCLPIDLAMGKVLEGGGLPVREPGKQAGGVVPPTAWSSGRETGQGKE